MKGSTVDPSQPSVMRVALAILPRPLVCVNMIPEFRSHPGGCRIVASVLLVLWRLLLFLPLFGIDTFCSASDVALGSRIFFCSFLTQKVQQRPQRQKGTKTKVKVDTAGALQATQEVPLQTPSGQEEWGGRG